MKWWLKFMCLIGLHDPKVDTVYRREHGRMFTYYRITCRNCGKEGVR